MSKFLPNHVIREIEANFTVYWRDSPEYVSKILADYQIKPEQQAMIAHLYKQFCPSLKYLFDHKPFIDMRKKVDELSCLQPNDPNMSLIRVEPICKVMNVDGFKCLQIPAGTPMYKGFRTFVTEEQEKAYLKSAPEANMPIWFGNLLVAYEYAQMYYGGLNAYVTKRPINMLVFTNYENIMKILNELQSLANKQVKKIKLAGEEFNIFYIMKHIRIKTGVFIKITKLMQEYLDYNKKTELLLSKTANLDYYKNMVNNELMQNNTCYMPKDDKTMCDVRTIPKLYYWGRGKIDRVVYKFINAYIKEKYASSIDGCMSIEHYSPFSSNGIVGEEFVLSDTYIDFLQRNVNDPYDWTQWVTKLPFKYPLSLNIRTTFDAKNINFRAVRFVSEHPENSSRNVQLFSKLTQKRSTKNIMILSFNVHFYESIDASISNTDAFTKMLALVNKVKPDVVCIQGDFGDWMSIEDRTNAARKIDYHYSGHLQSGLFVMTKKSVIIDVLVLPNQINTSVERRALIFSYEGFTIINTTLELGNKYTYRNGSLQTPIELYNTFMANSSNRMAQIKYLLQQKCDVICGTLYAEQNDPEMVYATTQFELNNNEYKTTTVFDTQFDYVMLQKGSSHRVQVQDVIDFPYSDHLPIVSLIQ